MKRIPDISSKAFRRLMSLLALLCLASIVLPLPIAPVAQIDPGKDTSQPFPCQNRPCGCRSAEQCWKKCCCFTNSQKVAWAKANGIELPDYVLAAAEKETTITRKPCALCSKDDKGKTKQKCEASVASTTGQRQSSASAAPTSASSAPVSRVNPARSRTSKWVLSAYSAECQGQPAFSLCFPASIVPARVQPVTISVEMTEFVHFVSERVNLTSLRPPLPPPKLV
jgi:hypothetical protein